MDREAQSDKKPRQEKALELNRNSNYLSFDKTAKNQNDEIDSLISPQSKHKSSDLFEKLIDHNQEASQEFVLKVRGFSHSDLAYHYVGPKKGSRFKGNFTNFSRTNNLKQSAQLNLNKLKEKLVVGLEAAATVGTSSNQQLSTKNLSKQMSYQRTHQSMKSFPSAIQGTQIISDCFSLPVADPSDQGNISRLLSQAKFNLSPEQRSR